MLIVLLTMYPGHMYRIHSRVWCQEGRGMPYWYNSSTEYQYRVTATCKWQQRYSEPHAAHIGNSVPTFRDSLSAPSSPRSLKMGPTGCTETSARNYNSTLSNIPEESKSDLHRGGSLKPRVVFTAVTRIARVGTDRNKVVRGLLDIAYTHRTRQQIS